jgi:uncharacterized protein (TIGR03437 family)
MLLQPAADRAFVNIVVGSNVAPDGTVSNTTDVYLVKSDGSQLRKLTAFSPGSGATAVAISPDGTRAAWIAVTTAGGTLEVHGFDIASGTDRLIAASSQTCGQSCLSALSFSQDGTELVWQLDSGPQGNAHVQQIIVGHFDGSGVQTVAFNAAVISNSPNITTADGRLIFLNHGCSVPCEQVDSIGLDGTGLTTLVPSPPNVNPDFEDPVISSDGSHYAYTTRSTPIGGPAAYPSGAVVVIPGSCTIAGGGFIFPGGLTVSGDGSQIAFLENNQVRTCGGASVFQKFFQATDVLLAADGSQMLYSVGQDSQHRGAVWIADANGGNAHPVFAPHSINTGGIVGLGSVPGNSLPLTPGSYFTIYGFNFENADALVTAQTTPFPATLAGVTVAVNGIAVPIQAVTPFQVNAILPQSFPTGPATVTVTFADGTTVTQSATVARSAAAVSTYISFGPNPGAAAFHAGTTTPADFKNPASPGEILETYGFGLGATTPIVAAGAAAPLDPPAITSFPAVSIGPLWANVTFAGLVPGLAGVYQVNVVVPALAAGPYELRWATIDPASGPAGSIWVN